MQCTEIPDSIDRARTRATMHCTSHRHSHMYGVNVNVNVNVKLPNLPHLKATVNNIPLQGQYHMHPPLPSRPHPHPHPHRSSQSALFHPLPADALHPVRSPRKSDSDTRWRVTPSAAPCAVAWRLVGGSRRGFFPWDFRFGLGAAGELVSWWVDVLFALLLG